MSPHRRRHLLILIMSSVAILLEVITIGILYQTALQEEQLRLQDVARSQARLFEAAARFTRTHCEHYPGGPVEATLAQIRDAHSRYEGFGETGEFTLAKKEGSQIIFVLSHRHGDLKNPNPVPLNSTLAEPMRLALSGRSGTVIAPDYRGVKVLAAFEPVVRLDMGVVAKIDLSEIRAPFLTAALLNGLIAIVFIIIGAGVFIKLTDPVLQGLNHANTQLKKALGEVKTLRGMIPICSYCKKIRNDRGYWDQLEVYVHEHTEADFTHGICPDCSAMYEKEIEKWKRSKKETAKPQGAEPKETKR